MKIFSNIESSKPLLRLFLIIFTITSFTACTDLSKRLAADQFILHDIQIEIVNSSQVKHSMELKDELKKILRQKPVKRKRRRKNYYYKFKDKDDLPWIKRWKKKKRAIAPTFLNLELNQSTEEDIVNYLRNKKGYYKAQASHDVKYDNKKAVVTYKVTPGPRYEINKIEYFTKDSLIVDEIAEVTINSLIKEGSPIDAYTFELEKQRIVSEMQNRGYADFNAKFIEIQGDSSSLNNKWDLFIEILPSTIGDDHTKYTIGDIDIYTDYYQNQRAEVLTTEDLYNKRFHKESEDFFVRPQLIDTKIYLNTGDPYNADNYYKTVKKFLSLGTYRFAKVSPVISNSADTIIDYKIFLTPFDKRWILDVGAETFFSSDQQFSNLLGFLARGGIENRNAFKGSEKFKLSLESGVELGEPISTPMAGPLLEVRTFSFGINSSLEFPALTKRMNILWLMNRFKLIKDETFNKLKNDASSTLNFGANFLDSKDLYKTQTINARYGYAYNISKRSRVTFNQIGLNYRTYSFEGNFAMRVKDNQVLSNSFTNSLFTGLLFNDLTHYYETKRPNKSNFVSISLLEISGLEVYAANQLVNTISDDNTWMVADSIEFEKLVKLQIDGRWYSKKNQLGQLVTRLKTGVVVPYGDDQTVSFIKQFFVGGPNSIRGWKPMELSPGTYSYQRDNPQDSVLFQRGEVLLEFNAEYRFDLLWLMEGALFIDGGNIWTLSDGTRPGSQFSLDFFNQFALGYGYGIRFDFNYFNIRFDAGFKLKHPAFNPDPNSSKLWVGPSGQGVLGNLNIAVNYPF